MKNDPYHLHKLSIAPLISSDPTNDFNAISTQLKEIGEKRLLEFLSLNMLEPLWFQSLSKNKATSLFSEIFINTLKQNTIQATAGYMAQKNLTNTAAEILRSANIPYVVYKGASIREQAHNNPAVRPSDDIDILISNGDQIEAIKALVKNGLSCQPAPENISHEITLTGMGSKIDLHWDIMRPGRTRKNMTSELLANRRQFNHLMVLDREAELFIMLVHPVITKYLTTPYASLIRIIDIIKWTESYNIKWQKIYELLDKSGLKTAAWINTYWLKLLTGKTMPKHFIKQLKPSNIRANYLQNWTNKNYSTKFLQNPMLIKVGFTLLVHDSLSDAHRAVKILQKERKRAQSEIEKIKSALCN